MRPRFMLFVAVTAMNLLGVSVRGGTSNLTLNVIYSFTNGWSPDAGVVIGPNGWFYGATATGGPGSNGGIYAVTGNGVLTNTIWFDGSNGAAPLAPLIQDARGNFYGTASKGGVNKNGTIFKIANGFQLAWVYSFNGSNGSMPLGPLVGGSNGSFYGTTYSGGSNSLGAIFAIDAAGTFSSVYSFSGSDGANPAAGLIRGSNGDLFGTTEYGGANGLGTVFELTYSGAVSNLGSFSESTGAFPGGLTEDAKGNVYGPTISGGGSFAGTIFELTAANVLTSLFTFGIANGASPNSPLILSQDGKWYGTTEQGGANGEGVIFCLNGKGALTDLISFDRTHGALPLSGMITGPDGNFYGTTSQGGANNSGIIYRLTGFSPFIIKPPASLKYASNHTALFTVTAGGSAPLSYQWQFDGTNAMNDIPGATNSSLQVTGEQLTNSGTYSVIVSNMYGTVSASAMLSVPTPLVRITSPRAGLRATSFVVNGTASAFAQVAAVDYWITNVNAGNVPATMTNSGAASLSVFDKTTNWAITNAIFLPGTNYIAVQAVDFLSNKSAFATREVFYKVTNLFTLITNPVGLGGVTGRASVAGDARPTNGAILNIGEGYTLTAAPDKGYVLTNWTATNAMTHFTSNAPTLHFIMESNMAITANFTTNLFLGASGTYNGLFYPTNGVTEQTSGMLYNLALHPNGTYSATLLLAGASYGFTGSFDTSGIASTNVKRTVAKGGPVSVGMTLNWTNGQIAGSVSNSAWVSTLEAEKATASTNSAEYTVLLAPGTNAIGQIPPGYGYILITNRKGSVTLSGALADGSGFSQAAPLGVLGDVPVFNDKLYASAGLLLGWLSLSNGVVEVENPMVWIKPAAKLGIYTNGFTNGLPGTGSGWTNPATVSVGTLIISNTSLDLNFAVSIAGDTVVEGSNNAPTDTLTGKIAPRTGLMTITFGNGAGKATTTGYAAILEGTTNGGGYFLTKTNAGTIILGP